ncbi:hypothetical protein OGAPHI_007293 [Ogataea philodendri]|uniref:SET domain-containing protein n=1 Tax=Ogataea philodendri TaxID=1378263 RepID=A0A9P8NUH0_9ASCO|nr:uncharacterized protein OGAPHI_007293 [Ogataea philodendri]KAH3660088.1 hypothetical protein OGAPHI_007293 [Ogataea philodendri]
MTGIGSFKHSSEFQRIKASVKKVSTETGESISKYYSNLPNNISINNPQDRGNAKRGVVLTRPHQAGETIHEFLPYLEVAETNESIDSTDSKDTLCAHCMKSLSVAGAGIECGDCSGFVKYCCEECMDADLLVHKVECLYLSAFDERERAQISCVERLILRLIICLGQDNNLVSQCRDLTSHHEYYFKFKQENNLVHVSPSQEALFDATESYSLGFLRFFEADLKGLIKLCFIIYVNSTVLQNFYEEPVGIMFDPFFSLINHSCEPNCILVWKGRTASLRALRPIATNEELFVSYCPVFTPKIARQQQLRNSFYFDCTCQMCSTEFDRWFPSKSGLGGMNWDKTGLDGVMIGGSEDEQQSYIELMQELKSVCSSEDMDDVSVLQSISTGIPQLNPEERLMLSNLAYKHVSVVPRQSWPMYKLFLLLKNNTIEDPIANLRFTVLTTDIENSLEHQLDFKVSLGMSFYEICIGILKLIRMQRQGEIDWNLDMLFWSALILALQANKHIVLKYNSNFQPLTQDLKSVVEDLRSLRKVDTVNEADAHVYLEQLSQELGGGVNLAKYCQPLEKEDVAQFNLILESGSVPDDQMYSNFGWLLQI